MKKILIIFLNICLLMGCSINRIQSDVHSINIGEYIDLGDTDLELLGVDESYIYLNQLNTFDDPFLFTTESLIMFDKSGKHFKQIDIDTHKRIIDFIEYNNCIYYMNLVFKENNYFIELCCFVDNQESILRNYKIDDPYSYPNFKFYNDKYYYKINNTLYNLTDMNKVFDLNNDFFLAKSSDKIYYKVSNGNKYQIYLFDNSERNIDIQDYIGNFIVYEQYIIFENTNDNHLYIFNKDTKKINKIYNNDIFDFCLVDNMIIISGNDKITIVDLNGKVLKVIEDKNIQGVTGWLFTDGNSIFIQNENEIIVIDIYK